jgi:hypothetical protein
MLTDNQQHAKADAERFYAGRQRLVHLEAAAAMQRALKAAPADASREQILVAAVYDLAAQTVDVSGLLPTQEGEKGRG